MIERKTIFSEDRIYRYTLWREWGNLFSNSNNYLMVIGLNPSTADEIKNDNTVSKLVNCAKRWNFDALCMTNLFGFRATDPRVMKAHPEPIGPDNDKWLVTCAKEAGLVLAGWGKSWRLFKSRSSSPRFN